MQDQPKTQAGAPRETPGAAPPAQAARRGGVLAPGIVFDSDMGRNIDAALALAMLYSLGPKGRVVAVGVSSSSLEAAAFCDAVGRFYAGDAAATSTGERSVLPVGLPEDGAKLTSAPMLSGPLEMKKPDGTPAFRSHVKTISDTADVRVLFRNALLTQRDGEGIVLLAGPATNLVRTLTVNGGRQAIATKVGLLVVAAGEYPEGAADPRMKADIESARQLFSHWPTPIVAVGAEVGNALPYPGRSIESDFSWSPNHPVVEAYRAFKAAPYDAPAQAAVAALYAGNPKEGYFKLSEPGTIEVLDDGRTRFSPSSTGKHRYLIVDPAQKERVLKAFSELAGTKPVPPAPRVFRNQQVNQAIDPSPAIDKPGTVPPKPGGRNQE